MYSILILLLRIAGRLFQHYLYPHNAVLLLLSEPNAMSMQIIENYKATYIYQKIQFSHVEILLESLLGRVVQGARLKIEYVRMREFKPHSRQKISLIF